MHPWFAEQIAYYPTGSIEALLADENDEAEDADQRSLDLRRRRSRRSTIVRRAP